MSRKRLIWREEAVADLERIDAWLSQFENANTATVRKRIGSAADKLERLGDIGRPGKVDGLRELSVRSAPYVLVYKVTANEIEILAVYHTAEDR